MLEPAAVIDDFLASHDLNYEQKDENTYLITLPGEAKQQTHCALIIGDHSLRQDRDGNIKTFSCN